MDYLGPHAGCSQLCHKRCSHPKRRVKTKHENKHYPPGNRIAKSGSREKYDQNCSHDTKIAEDLPKIVVPAVRLSQPRIGSEDHRFISNVANGGPDTAHPQNEPQNDQCTSQPKIRQILQLSNLPLNAQSSRSIINWTPRRQQNQKLVKASRELAKASKSGGYAALHSFEILDQDATGRALRL